MRRNLMRALNNWFPRLFLTRLALTCRQCGELIPYNGNPWEQGERGWLHWEANHDEGGDDMATEATRLKKLHDNLRFTLEDWDGHFHHEKEFERLFETAIQEAEGK